MIYVKGKEGLEGVKVNFDKFPNGELNIGSGLIKELSGVSDKVRVSWKYEESESIIELLFLVNYLEQINKEVIELVIYYLPYSRMDRVDKDTNNMFSLKYITNLINCLVIREVKVVEAHSDESINLLNNSKNLNLSKEIFNKVEEDKKLDLNNTVIMYPDMGAYLRYDYNLGYQTIYGNKVRDFKTGNIVGLDIEGEYTLKDNAVIIDDLTSKGTTFYKSAEKLYELGFKNVYLVVTHSENTITKGELLKCGIDKVYTTNSLLDTEDKVIKQSIEDKKLVVYEVEELLKQMEEI